MPAALANGIGLPTIEEGQPRSGGGTGARRRVAYDTFRPSCQGRLRHYSITAASAAATSRTRPTPQHVCRGRLRLLDALGIANAHALGHSMGGRVVGCADQPRRRAAGAGIGRR